MNNRDRETWERFAAAALSGMWANPARSVCENDACVSAYEMLTMTKQCWPDEPSGNPGQLPENPCSPRCETVTEPDRVPAKVPSEDMSRRLDAMSRDDGETVTVVEFDDEPETTPRGGEVRSEVRSADDGGVHELRSLETMLGPVVRRTDAERLIAAARREAEEARKECERLRLTDDERRLLYKYHRSEERAIVQFAVTSASYVADATHATAVIRGLLARHDKGGAA